MNRIVHLPEVVSPVGRLGRHVEHDEASKAFPAQGATDLVSVRHERHVPIFDQGQIGSCTGNAAVGCVSTGAFAFRGTEDDALSVYEEGTRLDGIDGCYPPTDTGSTGLAVCKALVARKIIAEYRHGFSLDEVLHALVLQPGIVGMTWLTGCDTPDAMGVVSYTGTVRGGHELCLVGLDVDRLLVWMANSWGEGWGVGGYFAMTFDDFGRALDSRSFGDVCFPRASV